MSRAFDILASSVALLILSPFLLITAAVIKVHDRGPVFYRATRVGKEGDLFLAYKFRTMVPNAEYSGPGITSSGDSRITTVGRVLRRTKADELPQLVNVLRGDMALVGPRPEDPRYVDLYTPDQRQVLSVRPGITSLASIHYRNEEQMLSGEEWEVHYRERVLPDKIAIDLQYLQSRSFWKDISILLRTLMSLFR